MEQIQTSMKRLFEGDPQIVRAAYEALLETVTEVTQSGKEAKRSEVAALLAAELDVEIEYGRTMGGKGKPAILDPLNKIIRLLSYVSTAKEVPALAKSMRDLNLREMARFALERNTSDEATAVLIGALDFVGPVFRVGVVNSLAKRRGSRVVAGLRKATGDNDPEVRQAAVEALANFPDPANDAIIAKMARCDCRKTRARAIKARVRLAETLNNAGQKGAARQIYRAIQGSNADAPQKKAAGIGLKA